MVESGRVRVRVPVRVDFAGGWTDVALFSSREGGAVLNGAISLYVEGEAIAEEGSIRLQYSAELPSGSGLGSSGAMDVAWLALTYGLMQTPRAPVELAEDAYRLEKLLGIIGGKQDQYAAALGGFNLLRFGHESEPAVVERLDPTPAVIDELESRAVLCYSGSSHTSSDVHEAVWNRYLAGDTDTAKALRDMRDSVEPAGSALLAGDFRSLAELMTLNREAARRLDRATVTDQMDELFAAGHGAGAIGSKACGAGGGGCLLFLTELGRREAVEAALREQGGEIITFQFEPYRESPYVDSKEQARARSSRA